MSIHSHRTSTCVAIVLAAGVFAGAVSMSGAGQSSAPSAKAIYQQALHEEEGTGNLQAAIALYQRALAAKPDRALAAQTLVRMAECYRKLGSNESRALYERILREYADQKEAAALARERIGTAAAPSSARITTRQLWTVPPAALDARDPEFTLGSTVSPDGRYFSLMEKATGMLMLHDFQTGDDRHLTTRATNGAKAFAEASVISRDGKRVAYAWFADRGGDVRRNGGYEVRVLDLNSTSAQPRVLFSNHEAAPWIFPYDWSLDDKWIAVQVRRADFTGQIALVSTADRTMRVLKSSSEWRRADVMAFSPDGRYLAYDLGPTLDANQHDVFVIATDGSRETAAVVNPAHDVVIGWTPDGKDLLFASDRSGSGGIWAVPMTDGKADGEPRLIKGDLKVRPRGLTRSGALYYSTTLSQQDIYVASVDLGTGKLLAPPARIAGQTVGFNLGAEWSPDGESLAYLPRRDISVVAIQSIATGAVRELRPDLAWVWTERPLWSPDSKSLVVVAPDKKGQWGLYRIDARTGATTMLVRSDDFSGNPVHPVGWSVDGRNLYFRRRAQVSTLDMQTGQERVVEGVLGRYGLSPDGRAWAWIDGPLPVHNGQPADSDAQNRSNSVSLKVMPVEGGPPRELLRASAPEDLRAPTWSPDGKFLMFFKLDTRDPNRTAEVWSIPVEGGPPRKIDLGGRVPRTPVNDADLNKPIRIHPDGRRIAIETTEPKVEIWVMENFLAQVQAGR
jgi:Tol biopolymer transport system component